MIGIPGFLLNGLFLAREDPMLLDLALDGIDDVGQAQKDTDEHRHGSDDEQNGSVQLNSKPDAGDQNDARKGQNDDRAGGEGCAVQVLIGKLCHGKYLLSGCEIPEKNGHLFKTQKIAAVSFGNFVIVNKNYFFA